MPDRHRINIAATVPAQHPTASVNVIVVWDAGSSVDDAEAAIKDAARRAVTRVRAESAATRYATGGYVNPPLPFP